ncbi:RNA polymerase-binding transcription factor DksA [Andreprevotia sp. IGB-42]|uniref:RNA polymerase-binding protein DksA n=1 Tax=Andreprevotia sp. IGB-42 TaxID=2497473 RepID=UPI001359BDA4|nr:RNA polymerase-binding protein DksA [Andreprevotia sp. IGB-42]KAF0814493.1 RNA polymerase-binding transcription factor DksA [Andreprevotia sp. IGB-42]
MTITRLAHIVPTLPAQLLASGDEYMSPAQRLYFRTLLFSEREMLLNAAHETAENIQTFQATPDPSDRASVEEDHALELRVRDRERKHLHSIDAALARLQDGSYGWCLETGEPIGLPRLTARPTATLALEAQERHEMRRKVRARR